MAEFAWMQHVTGGALGTGFTPREEVVNVPYAFGNYPISAGLPNIDLEVTTSATPVTSSAPGTLGNSHATWSWRSCQSCDQTPVVTVGGKLVVGVPFSRFLPVYAAPGAQPAIGSPFTFNTVEAWAKIRVDDKSKLSRIFFSINGITGGPISIIGSIGNDWLPSTTNNTWRVLYAKNDATTGNWTNWTNTNLRAVVTFQGADTLGGGSTQSTGLVNCDVEWFAFRLSEEEVA